MTHQKHHHQARKCVPAIITDPQTNETYRKGIFLGKGSFARCFELRKISDQTLFAGKVISKHLLDQPRQREKLTQEILINRMLCNPRIVNMHACFEDEINVYMILELCTQKSLLELQKRRKNITEPEARYFIKQITQGCVYIHESRIIHRDLKLGNVFLNQRMEVKIGDFGLSAILDNDHDRRQTLCGTPNYIAPEMIKNTGHTFAVDIWAIGCILYTLIVGSPPFSSRTTLETYQKIKYHKYKIPKSVSAQAYELIEALLNRDDSLRPIAGEIQKFAFFKGYTPSHLPITCLVSAPNYPSGYASTDGTTETVASDDNTAIRPSQLNHSVSPPATGSFRRISQMEAPGPNREAFDGTIAAIPASPDDRSHTTLYLSELLKRICELLVSCKNNIRESTDDSLEDPLCEPIYYVVKWVDFSDKYGIAYSLPDESQVVLFNDRTWLIMHGNGTQFKYIERKNHESFFTATSYPEGLKKKMTLMNLCGEFMSNNLRRTGEYISSQQGRGLGRIPILRKWIRSSDAIGFFFDNGFVQINFIADHTKLIICRRMDTVTYLDEKGVKHVMRIQTMINKGVPADVYNRLKFAKYALEDLIAHKSDFRAPWPLPKVSEPKQK